MRTEDGKQFYYVCPKCGKDVEGCPDPVCRSEGVGHHVDDLSRFVSCDGCDFDVVLNDLAKRYV
jgi:hypothetical protein